eukprot:85169-Prorocentrum_minimum.AAC.2
MMLGAVPVEEGVGEVPARLPAACGLERQGILEHVVAAGVGEHLVVDEAAGSRVVDRPELVLLDVVNGSHGVDHARAVVEGAF